MANLLAIGRADALIPFEGLSAHAVWRSAELLSRGFDLVGQQATLDDPIVSN